MRKSPRASPKIAPSVVEEVKKEKKEKKKEPRSIPKGVKGKKPLQEFEVGKRCYNATLLLSAHSTYIFYFNTDLSDVVRSVT